MVVCSSFDTQKCLQYVPESRPPSRYTLHGNLNGDMKQNRSAMTCPNATLRAPWANSFNAPPIPYTWKKPEPLPNPPRPAPAQTNALPAPAITRAGQGPDPRRGRGLGQGRYREKYTHHGFPYPRDEIGINRRECTTTKDWDTNCGKIAKLPPVSTQTYSQNHSDSKSRLRCDLRNNGQTDPQTNPVPAGLQKILPHDIRQWPEVGSKPMVRLNDKFEAHTRVIDQHGGMPPPPAGQSLTRYGGAQHLYRPTAPPATIERLFKGEMRWEYDGWTGSDRGMRAAGKPSERF
mmetsp:Transcript_26963/g.58849  ORF Transcript_26963/g.58849 Transcript_26963/m.58849 type:complete len:290 (-) Transcript_26963:312-1181(-)